MICSLSNAHSFSLDRSGNSSLNSSSGDIIGSSFDELAQKFCFLF
jgi:hypothetical protein